MSDRSAATARDRAARSDILQRILVICRRLQTQHDDSQLVRGGQRNRFQESMNLMMKEAVVDENLDALNACDWSC
jgi:hypothetical protein